MEQDPKLRCEKCSRKFTRAFNLKRHERVHSGSQDFPCTSCQKRFRYENDCKIHERRHFEPPMFLCEPCGGRYTKFWSLKRHRKTCSKALNKKPLQDNYSNVMETRMIKPTDGYDAMVLRAIESQSPKLSRSETREDARSDAENLDITDRVSDAFSNKAPNTEVNGWSRGLVCSTSREPAQYHSRPSSSDVEAALRGDSPENFDREGHDDIVTCNQRSGSQSKNILCILPSFNSLWFFGSRPAFQLVDEHVHDYSLSSRQYITGKPYARDGPLVRGYCAFDAEFPKNEKITYIPDSDEVRVASFLLSSIKFDEYGAVAPRYSRNVYQRAWFMAARYGMLKALQILHEQYDVNLESRSRDGKTALEISVETGRLNSVRLLLLFGVDVYAKNNRRRTPIHLTVVLNQWHILFEILKYIYDNVHSTRLNRKELLDTAVEDIRINPEYFEALLGRMINIDDRDTCGRTILHDAAAHAKIWTLILIIGFGAAVDAKTENGNTALHIACGCDRHEITAVLLNAGASKMIINGDGFLPWQCANSDGRIVLLESHASPW